MSSRLGKVIPAPPVTGLLGHLVGHVAETHALSRRNQQTIGMALYVLKGKWYNLTKSKTVQLNMAGKKIVLCADPAVYKDVLGSKQDSFVNHIAFKAIFGYFFPTAMIVVDGEQWQRIRKIVQRAITKQSLDPLVRIVCETTDKLLTRTDINMTSTSTMMERITFDAFHRVMYNWDPQSVLESKDSISLLNACNTIGAATAQRAILPIPWLWYLPTSENRNIDKACKFVRDYIVNFVSDRRQAIKLNGEAGADTLLDAMIVASESGEDGGMTDAELYDQIATLFFGAYDTTSASLLFILNYLARYPEVQDKLRSAISNKFPRFHSELQAIKVEDFDSIPYLNNFIDEVNRLHAIAPMFVRSCIKDVEVGGYHVSADTDILIDSSAACLDQSLWNGQADLERFRPERWDDFRPSKLVGPLAFGFGGRICLGRKIALSEMKVFVAAVLLNYKVALRQPEKPLELEMAIGLNIKRGTGDINFFRLQ